MEVIFFSRFPRGSSDRPVQPYVVECLCPRAILKVKNHWTYSCARPAQSESYLVGKELAEAEHETVDERQDEVNGSAPDEGPERRRFVQDERRAGR